MNVVKNTLIVVATLVALIGLGIGGHKVWYHLSGQAEVEELANEFKELGDKVRNSGYYNTK